MSKEKSCKGDELGKRCYSSTCDDAYGEYGAYCPVAYYCSGYVPSPKKPENVSHPSHYQGEYECIDLMREIYGDEAVRWFCILNIYKYRFRAGKKEAPWRMMKRKRRGTRHML